MKEGIAILSVFVNFILAVGKTIVGIMTNSAAILAEGIHSGMDILSSGVSLAGIKISNKPVDEKHPYGHYKFEVMSGLIITILLFAAGIWMIYEAYKGFIAPEIMSISYLALSIMSASVILNEIMARLKIHYGKKENSISLLSDGVHDKVDVYASLAVLVGIFLMPYWIYIDSILALLIGIYIIKESFELGAEATDSLLDASAGKEIEDKIKEIAKQNNIKIDELKTQKKGSAVTANIEIKLDKNITVEKATKISGGLKEKLIESINPLEYVAIQIKSHELTNISFEPKGIDSKISTGMGFGWQRKGKFTDEIKEAKAKGPEGYCVCPKCNHKQKHEKGIPCSATKCSKCGQMMSRE